MSTVSTVNSSVTNASNLFSGANLAGTNSTLNQNDFLKLLVSQIQFQDPLNPKSNTDMAAQMAQFTSLSQASETSASLAMIQANSLIGSQVSVQIDSLNSKSGVVSGVSLVNGKPQILVNGQHYNLNQVTSVQAVSPTLTQTDASSSALQELSATHTDPVLLDSLSVTHTDPAGNN